MTTPTQTQSTPHPVTRLAPSVRAIINQHHDDFNYKFETLKGSRPRVLYLEDVTCLLEVVDAQESRIKELEACIRESESAPAPAMMAETESAASPSVSGHRPGKRREQQG